MLVRELGVRAWVARRLPCSLVSLPPASDPACGLAGTHFRVFVGSVGLTEMPHSGHFATFRNSFTMQLLQTGGGVRVFKI